MRRERVEAHARDHRRVLEHQQALRGVPVAVGRRGDPADDADGHERGRDRVQPRAHAPPRVVRDAGGEEQRVRADAEQKAGAEHKKGREGFLRARHEAVVLDRDREPKARDRVERDRGLVLARVHDAFAEHVHAQARKDKEQREVREPALERDALVLDLVLVRVHRRVQAAQHRQAHAHDPHEPQHVDRKHQAPVRAVAVRAARRRHVHARLAGAQRLERAEVGALAPELAVEERRRRLAHRKRARLAMRHLQIDDIEDTHTRACGRVVYIADSANCMQGGWWFLCTIALQRRVSLQTLKALPARHRALSVCVTPSRAPRGLDTRRQAGGCPPPSAP